MQLWLLKRNNKEKKMALVKAICTNCGANLEVDNTKEAGICRHCRTAYIVEKTINKYNMHIQNTLIYQVSHTQQKK